MPGPRGALVGLGVVVTALGAPAAQAGKRTAISAATPIGGPVFAGEAVVWAEQGPRGVDVKIRRARNRPRLVARLRRRTTGPFERIYLAASRTRIGLVRDVLISQPRGESRVMTETWTGPVAGPLRRTSACRLSYPLPGVAVSGEVVAFVGENCGRDYVVVRDYARGGRPERIDASANPARPVAGGLRIAGRFLAWRTSDPNVVETGELSGVTVYDRETGHEAYRVRTRRDGTGIGIMQVDLQDDGKLVAFANRDVYGWADGPGCADAERAHAWWAIEDPRPHCVPPPAGIVEPSLAPARPRVAGDAFVRIEPAGPGRVALALVSLSGTTRPVAVVRNGQLIGGSHGGAFDDANWFDFDGRRIGWAERGCYRGTIFVADVAGPPAPPAGGSNVCRIRVRGPREIRAGRSGAIRVPVICPRGCVGQVAVRLPVSERNRALADVAYDLRPGAHSLRFELSRRHQRKLQLEGRMTANLFFSTRRLDAGHHFKAIRLTLLRPR